GPALTQRVPARLVSRTPAVGVADILGGLVPDRVATPEKCRAEAARLFETWQGKGLAQRTPERPDRGRPRRDSQARAFRRPEREFDWLSSPRMMALRGEVFVAHSPGPPSVHNRTPELSVPWFPVEQSQHEVVPRLVLLCPVQFEEVQDHLQSLSRSD